jgi:hypothetical protein
MRTGALRCELDATNIYQASVMMCQLFEQFVGVNPNISRLAGLVLESVKVVLVLAGQFANLCPRDGTSSNSIGQVQI